MITHKENKVEDKTKNVDKIILRENDCTGDTLSKSKQLIENNCSNAKNETCCLIESSNMRNKRQSKGNKDIINPKTGTEMFLSHLIEKR